MTEELSSAEIRILLHELKQPLNVIRLAGENMRNHLDSRVAEPSAGYLRGKLDRVDEQTRRAAEIVDSLLRSFSSSSKRSRGRIDLPGEGGNG